VWLAGGIWLLLQRSASAPAKTLAWSGLLYGTSFLIVGVATDYQYHLWTILSIGLALGIHFSRQEDWIEPLKRLAVVAGIVIVAGYIARVAML
jgi:mannose/fructose/N-acetylgalactosamine-specific phosphotransferase system component IID